MKRTIEDNVPSIIGILYKDGSVKYVNCRWKGQCNRQYEILDNYYNSLKKIEELLSLGYLCEIRERVAPTKGEFHCYENPVPDVTIAYFRDGQGMWDYVPPKSCISVHELMSSTYVDYIYLFEESSGAWLCQKTN